MAWRRKVAKYLGLAGMVACPFVLAFGFHVGLLGALLGGVALGLVPPMTFVVLMDMVDQLRAPAKQPPQRPSA